MTLLDTLRAQLAALLKECARVCENTPAPPASGEHRNGYWCDDLRCAKCYSADAWLKSEAARLARELAEARGRENHALARLDAARAELAEARARIREMEAKHG
jgi:hypothetical protein